MNYRLQIIMAAVVMAVGCSKSDIPDPSIYLPGDSAIEFSSAPDNWGASTRGLIYNDVSFDRMKVCAFYTGEKSWAQSGESDIEIFMKNQSVKKDDNDVWSYSPPKYWPANDQAKISFFGFTPNDRVKMSIDNQTGRPEFKYTLLPQADENGDLLATVQYDKTNSSAATGVELPYKHALTYISLTAMLKEEITPVEGESNVEYYIDDIEFLDIASTGAMVFDDSGAISWDVDYSVEKISYLATQSTTLLPFDDPEAKLTTTPMDLCIDGKAIFFLPQEVEGCFLEVRIRKQYDHLDIDGNTEQVVRTYETKKLPIPTPAETSGRFEAGQCIEMSFEFDANNLSQYNTPMSVTSKIHPWNDIEIDVDAHKNVYMYTSNLNTHYNANMDAVFTIYTNYYNDIRVPNRRVELDGEITTSRGLVFHSSAFTLNNETEIEYKPTMLNDAGEEIICVTKDNTNISESDRNEDGTYTDPFSGKICKYDNHGFEFVREDVFDTWHPQYFVPGTTMKAMFPIDSEGKSDVTWLEDDEGVIQYVVKVGEITPADKLDPRFVDYEFHFSVRKSNRKDENLYVSTVIANDSSYGVNKKKTDPVYILTLSHDDSNETLSGGTFVGVIGVEMLGNGGGMLEMRYNVTASEAAN